MILLNVKKKAFKKVYFLKACDAYSEQLGKNMHFLYIFIPEYLFLVPGTNFVLLDEIFENEYEIDSPETDRIGNKPSFVKFSMSCVYTRISASSVFLFLKTNDKLLKLTSEKLSV